MPTINITTISDGDTASAAQVNTPLNTIVNAINGNLDSDNLAANAVTTAKIADANVTSAKLEEAFFKGRRQANTTNSDISGYKVQHGWGFMVGSGAASTTETVTLPTAFSSAAYIVVVTSLGYKASSDPSSESDSTIAASLNGTAKILNSSTFTAGLHDSAASMGGTTRFLYSWIAIGPA